MELPYRAPFSELAALSPSISPRFLVEDFPKPQRLVSGSRDDRLAIRAHRQVEHTERMAGQGDDLLHAGIFPDHDLVLAVAVRANDLVRVFRPT